MVKGEKFTKYLAKFDKVFIQQKLNEGLTIRMISPIVEVPERRLGEMVEYFDLSVTNKSSTHIVNHKYFDEIDSEEKAYFLGFLVADGCVTKDVRKSGFLSKRITFCNSVQDKEIIEKFRDVVCPTVKINWKNNSTDTITRRDQASFKFTSEHMFDTLVGKYGIVERKTHDLTFKLPDLGGFMRHFIRGFMDGDGHVRRNQISFIFTSKDFMNQVSDYFENKLFTTRYNVIKGKTVDYYRHYVNMSKVNIQEMYVILYADASVYLERKRVVFESEITNRYNLELPIIDNLKNLT